MVFAQTDDCDSNSFLSETTRIMPLPTSRLIHREQSTIALMDRRFKFDGLTDRKAERSCPTCVRTERRFGAICASCGYTETTSLTSPVLWSQ